VGWCDEKERAEKEGALHGSLLICLIPRYSQAFADGGREGRGGGLARSSPSLLPPEPPPKPPDRSRSCWAAARRAFVRIETVDRTRSLSLPGRGAPTLTPLPLPHVPGSGK
jgi:hypothetical protein